MSNNSDANAGVLGYAFDIRTERDKQMLVDFSCNRGGDQVKEGYLEGVTAQNIFIEPRTIKDQMLLATFNPCVCNGAKEGYRKENYRR